MMRGSYENKGPYTMGVSMVSVGAGGQVRVDTSFLRTRINSGQLEGNINSGDAGKYYLSVANGDDMKWLLRSSIRGVANRRG
jgi:hypothetical protein